MVEDHELVASAMTILLESVGHEVRCAPSVAQAFDTSRDWRPDVMLLDLTLPDGSGLELLTLLRDVSLMPPVVVALTGHDDPATTARCRAAGCQEVLLKPVPTRTLIQLVDRWSQVARDGARTEE